MSAPGLPTNARVGVVCAHPDDESFGLGAIITWFVDAGARVELLCLTRGEASSLGVAADLAARREVELRAAAQQLGISRITVRDHPDGALASEPLEPLIEDALEILGDVEVVLTFDHGGLTGHPDHQRATDVAVAVGKRRGLEVLGWAMPEGIATQLREELGAPFVGRPERDLAYRLTVDRTRQDAAMACHESQRNPLPHRRIALQGPVEHLRILHRPTSAVSDGGEGMSRWR